MPNAIEFDASWMRFGDCSFNFKVKTVVGEYGFKLEVKIVVTNYGFKH